MLRYSCVIQRVVGKLTLISFLNNNEDHELELWFGQTLYSSTMQEKALDLKLDFLFLTETRLVSGKGQEM